MNRATVQELQCFIAVAEELSFSRAASRLHMSQPPLSRQIQSLEAKLGSALLLRNTRTVSLTAAGTLFLQDARRILMQLDSAADAARRAGQTGRPERLRLAFVGALLDEHLVRVLQAFRRSRPECQLHLTDLPPADQLQGLRDRSIDGAFIGAAPQGPQRDLSWITWKREPLLLAFPGNHPLARGRLPSFDRLQAEPWVMVSRKAAPAFRQQFDTLCAKSKIRARVVQESDRVPAVLTMVAAGQGISLLPASVSHLLKGGVAFRSIPGKQPVLEHTFAWHADAESGPVCEFVKLLNAQ